MPEIEFGPIVERVGCGCSLVKVFLITCDYLVEFKPFQFLMAMKVAFVSLVVSTVFFKVPFGQKWQDLVRHRIRRKYHVLVSISRVKLNINRIEIIGMSYHDTKTGNSVKAGRLVAKLQVGFRGVRIKEIAIDEGDIKIERGAVTEPKEGQFSNAQQDSIQRLSVRLIRLIKYFIYKAPVLLKFKNLKLSAQMYESKNIAIEIGRVFVVNGKSERYVHLNSIFPHEELSLANEYNDTLSVDFADIRVNDIGNSDCIAVESASVQLNCNVGDYVSKFQLLAKTGKVAVTSPFVTENTELNIEPVTLRAKVTCDRSGFVIDPVTCFNFNKLAFSFSYDHPFKKGTFKEVGLKLNYCTVQEFLDSFPAFVTKDIYTVTFTGGFGFDANFKFKTAAPKPHSFDLKVRVDAGVKDFGKLDMEFLKFPFRHSIYQNGKKVREIELTKENPHVVNIESISELFVKTILCCEDYNYYKHNGIDVEAIGFSLRANIVSGRFARGASTITMQLMRNLFLSHQKCLYRKVEEVLLTLLVGSAHVDKRRQLEIYLNIIEFGRDLYGVAAAAEYYFGRTPAELSLTESLVLSYVLPRPKFFHDALLQRSPQLVSNLGKHLEVSSRAMLMHGFINFDEFRSVVYDVTFANGLGKFSFPHPTDNLHATLSDVYFKVLKLWAERYCYLASPFISCAYRSHEEQLNLYNQGRKNPGNVITNAMPGESPHNYSPSLAFDVGFKDIYDQFDWSEDLFRKFAEIVKEVDINCNVRWGGDFVSFKDMPHFELSNWKSVDRSK
jgi:hypothetical protein